MARDMHIMTMVMHQTDKLEGTENGPERREPRNGCATGQMRVSTAKNDGWISGKSRKTRYYSPRKVWARFSQSAGGGVRSLERTGLWLDFPDNAPKTGKSTENTLLRTSVTGNADAIPMS